MLIAIVIVTVVGIISGILLSILSKLFEVSHDETLTDVRTALPGANCGACGYAGCDEYAKAVVLEGAAINLCTPGGKDTARALSEIMNVPYADVQEIRAIVRCAGDYDTTEYVLDYRGRQSCKAANLLYNGPRACSSGCLGHGDCVHVCQFDAIEMINGLSVIHPEKCTGCGACAKQCPNLLIAMVPSGSDEYVACSSHDKGAYVRKICKAGCIGCMRCQKACEYDAIKVNRNLAAVDPDKCVRCGACVEVCPTKVIRHRLEEISVRV